MVATCKSDVRMNNAATRVDNLAFVCLTSEIFVTAENLCGGGGGGGGSSGGGGDGGGCS